MTAAAEENTLTQARAREGAQSRPVLIYARQQGREERENQRLWDRLLQVHGGFIKRGHSELDAEMTTQPVEYFENEGDVVMTFSICDSMERGFCT